jgi:uncharacterized protein (DUF302 family)
MPANATSESDVPQTHLAGGTNMEGTPMLHVVESKKPLSRVTADLEQAVSRHKFGILGVHDLRAKMTARGVEFAREYRIDEVCNPKQTRKVLERNMEISTALPCRISVYEEGGGTRLATISQRRCWFCTGRWS